MGTETDRRLRVFFVPFMCPSHMNPMLDIAKLFSLRGAAPTIVTTPGNAPLVRSAIDSFPIDLILLPFPSSVAHLLPDGQENTAAISFSGYTPFFTAFYALHTPLDELLRFHRPDAIVSDVLFPATADTAADLGVPRIVFHCGGVFALSVNQRLELQGMHKSVSGDDEAFVVDGLPHHVETTRTELSMAFLHESFQEWLRKSEEKSYGMVVNSFYELEPAYAEHYRSLRPGRRVWYVGPVSLYPGADDQVPNPSLDRWLSWLDSKPASSVLFVCFGSICELSVPQLRELAAGLETAGHPFVWVLRDGGGGAAASTAEWMPAGMEDQDRCLIIRGWASQVAILGHPAVGGFMTHCGWNSTLEAAVAGMPTVTWPLAYEQFVNERFITEVARTGVSIGRRAHGTVVGAATVAAAVGRVMGGREEAEGMRRRASEIAARAKAAVAEGGTSYIDVDNLIADLMMCSDRAPGKKIISQ